jgi:hypothetical protein
MTLLKTMLAICVLCTATLANAAAPSMLHDEIKINAKQTKTATVSVPHDAEGIKVVAKVKNANGEWSSVEAIGWASWVGASDTIVGTERVITRTLFNDKHDWDRIVRLEVFYEPRKSKSDQQ